jgi:transposase
MAPTSNFAQLQLHFVDQIQWRYELIRPLVLFEHITPTQRAEDTHTHPDTVRTLTRRFRQQGMLGLVPDDLEVTPRGRAPRVPQEIRQELDRLKALYAGFHYRELARIIWYKCGYRITDKTAKQLWQQSPIVPHQQLELWDYPTHPERYQARLHVVRLYYQGWDKLSISRFLHVSRPTVDRWIARFEAEHFEGLFDHKRGPKSPRKVWFPVMVEVYHLGFCSALKRIKSVGFYQGEAIHLPSLGLDVPKPGPSMTVKSRAAGPQYANMATRGSMTS